MKMLPYLIDRAADYGRFDELIIDPMHARACSPDWNITDKARMPHTGITMKMKSGIILGQQLAIQADSTLETIDESLSTVTGSRMIMRDQDAAGVCYLCPSVDTSQSTVPYCVGRRGTN